MNTVTPPNAISDIVQLVVQAAESYPILVYPVGVILLCAAVTLWQALER
jgi:hypothetical protein